MVPIRYRVCPSQAQERGGINPPPPVLAVTHWTWRQTETKKKENEKMILALDPGTKCGWAVANAKDVQISGVWDLAPHRHEGGGMRFMRLRNYLAEILRPCLIEAAYYEEVAAHKGTAAAQIYGGIVATLQTICEERRIPYAGIPVGTIKRTATGKGNANKDAMMAAAASRWPDWVCVDDNEADARWIAVTALDSQGIGKAGVSGLGLALDTAKRI